MSQRRRFLPGRSAVGEVIIVIIGVLIALAVESWWSGRQDAAAADRHLAALRSDFETNQEYLESTLNSIAEVRDQIRLLLAISHGSASRPSADSLSSLTWDVFYPTVFEPSTSAYDNLLSTEGFQLLRDSKLRRNLTDFASALSLYQRTEWQWTQWNFMSQPFVNSKLRALDWVPRRSREAQGLPEPRVRIDWDEVLSDPEFEGILVNRFVSAGDSERNLQALKSLLDQIVVALNAS